MPEYSDIYETAIDRIKSVYHSCSAAEQTLLLQILQEMGDKGYSETLETVWLADFKEVPVGIDQFLDDPYYLGQTNSFGKNVYPYWRQTFKKIFNAGNQYNEIILSGATRLGKTSSAVTIMSYMLYRLMLYRDPHSYFQKKAISKFTLGFANLTKELAFSVAYREFNDTLKEVPWFMDRGKVTRSDRNFYYLPDGDKIEIIAASDGAQLLGKQLWCCLKGDTQILTLDGVKSIESCADTKQTILQLVGDELIPTEALVKRTRYVTELIRVELEDGTVIEGTPDHRVMLSDGTYKALDSLTDSDVMLRFNMEVSEFNPIEKSNIHIKSLNRIQYSSHVPVYDVINVEPEHNFIVVGNDSLIVSHNCLIDEANFAKSGVKDIDKAKQHMKGLYDTVNARISGTFRLNGEVYGKMITASSKNQDNDYLSEHIETQQRAGNEHLYLVDEPQWKILPKSMFSDKVFHFTVGDRYKRGFVIPEENDDEEHRKEYEAQGYKVIEAPAELRKNFLADYDISLRDIAGISVAGAMGFITQEMITPCVAQDRQNPFFEDVLVIGMRDQGTEISDYFHPEVVPNELKYQQMNIHIDFAETRNRTGISGSCVCGNKIIENVEGKKVALPFIKQVFSVGIEAPRGDRQSFQKVVNFMIYLRQQHFNIGTISTDQYQSSFVRETLSQQGFTVDKISISGSMDAFIAIKNLLIDQRIELVKNQLQEDEFVSIQRVNNKIEIPLASDGGHGDLAEAATGSAYSLVLDQVSSRPPAKSIAAIAAAVNTGRGRSATNPMSSSNTVSNRPAGNYPNRFPKLR